MEVDYKRSAHEEASGKEFSAMDELSRLVEVTSKCLGFAKPITTTLQSVFDGPNPFVIDGIPPVQVGRAASQREGASDSADIEIRKSSDTSPPKTDVAKTALARLSADDRETVYLSLARLQIASSGEEKALLEKLVESKLPGIETKDIPPLPPEKLQPIARKSLEDIVSKLFRDDDSRGKEFRDDMKIFEKRMRGKPGEQEEIGKTYLQLARLLGDSNNAPCDQKERSLLARQIILNAANPTNNVNQGNHNSCTAAAVEVRTYSLYPGQAARVIADIGLTGEYKTASGKVVTLDSESRSMDKEAKDFADFDDCWKIGNFAGKRNYASQVFQITAVNAFWKTQGGDIRYSQVRTTEKGDTGERLQDFADPKNPKVTGQSPGIFCGKVSDMSYEITGRHEVTTLFPAESENFSEVDTLAVNNAKHLRTLLTGATHGKLLLPLIIRVDTQNKPFSDYSKAGKDGAGGGHVLNIMDYNVETDEVTVDNTWGVAKDHTGKPGEKPKIKLADLEAAMHTPEKKK